MKGIGSETGEDNARGNSSGTLAPRMDAALDDLVVVEMDTSVAGSVAGMILADYGARVIKVEDPETGLRERGNPGFAVWNRNKASFASAYDDRRSARFADLITDADVCITGCVADPDPRALAALNPLLVVAALPPYRGPTPWAGGGEDASLLDALSGLSMRQSSFDGVPVDLVYPHTLYIQGLWAATCAVGALVERAATGKGQILSVDGLSAALITGAAGFVFDPSDDTSVTPVGPGGASPCYTRYRCSDGEWLFLGALLPRFQRAAFETLGIADLPDDPRIAGDLRRILSPENRRWVRTAMQERFFANTREHWLAVLEEAGCPAGPVLDRDGWLDHPQLRACGQRVEVDDPERGPVVMPGLLIDIPEAPGQIISAAPLLGDLELSDVRAERRHGPERASRPGWQRPAPSIAARTEFQAANAGTSEIVGPLNGVKVLNLGTILAGPLAGSLLAALGAEVVKVEPPEGDAFREPGFSYNRGMRSVSIDLRTRGGLEAFSRLAREADMVIDNYRHGVAKRLGVDHSTLSAFNPALGGFSLTGFGETGPLATKAAFDPLLQAMSGMMAAQGGDDEPVFLTVAVNDVAAGVAGALSTCLSLYYRTRTGRGLKTSTSLAAVSAFMQSGELVRYPGRPTALRGGRDFPGPNALDRFYRVRDGWVRLRATRDDLPGLVDAGLVDAGLVDAGLVDAGLVDAGLLEDDQSNALALAAILAGRVGSEVVRLLTSFGVKAAEARSLTDLASDLQLRETDLFSEHPVAGGSSVLTPGRWVSWEPPRPLAAMRAPGLGEHTAEVLVQAGFSMHEVDELVRCGCVVAGGPMVVGRVLRYR
jgi:crotonobetainyl-CoA:carnitine CoA-transferase CaiB-like acyl-CoA transferase